MLIEKLVTLISFHSYPPRNSLPYLIDNATSNLYRLLFEQLIFIEPKDARNIILDFCDEFKETPLIEAVRRITMEHFSFSQEFNLGERNYGNNAEKEFPVGPISRLIELFLSKAIPLGPSAREP